MTLQYVTDINGKRRGVFLSIEDWNMVKEKLDSASNKLKLIEKKRNDIFKNYKKSQKEKHVFSSDISHLKNLLK